MHRLTKFSIYFMLSGVLALGLLSTSCSRKSGCPAEDAHIDMDKNGSYKKTKPKSGLGLVPKDAKKRNKD